ncbi:MAG: hypothetical protein KZQ58_00930 [gamma proteobacterium symbiont of Bathyaustriella thionipta]|nr:hypothetical protein [gamma proteobacterium symbiont of Bathyaustriella thionipta]
MGRERDGVGRTVTNDVVELDEKEISRIQDMLLDLGEGQRLKPVFDALDGAVDYGVLRCIHASQE